VSRANLPNERRGGGIYFSSQEKKGREGGKSAFSSIHRRGSSSLPHRRQLEAVSQLNLKEGKGENLPSVFFILKKSQGWEGKKRGHDTF